MNKKILEYLSNYCEVTPEMEAVISRYSIFKNFKKGEVFQCHESALNECYFVIEGCIRTYILQEGEEKTIEFYTEKQVVITAESSAVVSSNHYLECIEDTIVCIGNSEIEEKAFIECPALEKLSRIIGESVLRNREMHFADFKNASPEKRFLDFLEKRPSLINRVPQAHLASYLGIKPESLSRIKKRIYTKGIT